MSIKRTSIWCRALAAVSCLALPLSLVACGDNVDDSDTANRQAGQASGISGEFYGAGASSQQGATEAWIASYRKTNSQANIAYNPTGSGAGVTTFMTGATAWAGSDAPLSDAQVDQSAAVCASGTAFDVPVYISPIAIVFNLRGVFSTGATAGERHLNLDAVTVARMFDGQITRWNDDAIKEQNPLVDLPYTPITVVHRSDKSGTTQSFTSYLKAAAGEAWPHDPQENWPNDVGQAAKGTDGVVTTVSQADGTIGYVDAAKTGDFGTIAVKVGSAYVPPSPAAASKVVDASALRQFPKSSGRVVVDVNYATQAKDSYPVVLVSYAVACPAYKDAGTGRFVRSWLEYVTGSQGQKVAQDNTGSAPLGSSLREKVARSVAKVQTS